MSNNTDIALSVKNISKVYQKSDKNGRSTDFHALKDVSFDVKKGAVIGIIGKNGSGKSTLLKILSGITKPSIGEVELNGTVASILDIGTGFHPDLTGRENVFLRGELLGMSINEISSIFNKIVEFSEIGDFLDTAVKHYSSGMFLRLAFSIIIHLKADILILDEVMSVGDLGFRKKCESYLNETNNKTIIIVGHNINELATLTTKLILFDKGEIVLYNNFEIVLEEYNRLIDKKLYKPLTNSYSINEVYFKDNNGTKRNKFYDNEKAILTIKFNFHKENFNLGFMLTNSFGDRLMSSGTHIYKKNIIGKHSLEYCIETLLFNDGFYFITLIIFKDESKFAELQNIVKLNISKEKIETFGMDFPFPLSISKKSINLKHED